MRTVLFALLLLAGCPEPAVDARSPAPTPVDARLPPLSDDTPAPAVRASRQQVLDYLVDLDPDERADLLAEVLAEAARIEAARPDEPGEPPVQAVELGLPPLRPGLDDTDNPEPVEPAPDPARPLTLPAAPPAAPAAPQPAVPASPGDGAVKPDLSDPRVYACSAPGDCAITCAMDCCGAPCGCTTAVNKSFKPAIERWGKRDCPSPRSCPAVGCIRQEAMGATCREGRCRAVMSPSGF